LAAKEDYVPKMEMLIKDVQERVSGIFQILPSKWMAMKMRITQEKILLAKNILKKDQTRCFSKRDYGGSQ
jgi:hypothetical protein